MTKIFIDGEAGTTGLRIHERLAERGDLEIIHIDPALRKDPHERQRLLNEADIAFLCLPDAASIEAVELLESDTTVLIDTSTAHRVNDDWVYGFPEINGLENDIKSSKRIANPGCHASGFVSLIAPLVCAGVLRADTRLTSMSLTGYSGAGKKGIAQYEEGATLNPGTGFDGASSSSVIPADLMLQAPRMYGIAQTHKHIPEMVKVCGLEKTPAFMPVIAPYYAGMEVVVTLFPENLCAGKTIEDVKATYASVYQSGLVHYVEKADEDGFMSALAYSGRDDMEVTVVGNEDRILCVSRFDNLGKGASGAAIQNMNIVLGVDPATGLNVG